MIIRPLYHTDLVTQNGAGGEETQLAESVQNGSSHGLDTDGSREEQLARLGLSPNPAVAATLAHRRETETLPVAALRALAEEFVAEGQRMMLAPSTIEGKNFALRKFFWWLEANHCQNCGRAEVQRFLDYIITSHGQPGGRWGRGNAKLDPEAARFIKPITTRTLRYYYKHLRHFFSWVEGQGHIGRSPMTGVEVAKAKKPLIQPFAPDQFEALIKAARRSIQPRRDEALFTFLYDTGLRASELCSLRLSNLEFDKTGRSGRVKFVGKGSKERIVPFAQRTRTLLWNYLLLAPRNGEDKIFIAERGWHKGCGLTPNGLLQLFVRTGEAAGLTGVRCSPHTMRHTFAINFLRRGGDIRTLAYLMGHESISMTMVYLRISEADAENQHRLYSPADALNF